ncbi:MAG: ferrous iron transport protein B [Ruminococcus sp.]|nr:ferrous iron transport protein B [Ruminococcus sp.]
MTLNELTAGKSAEVTAVGGEGALRQHFLDMGLIPGVQVTLVKFAPMGDPMELRLHGYELTLRLDDAKHIDIVPKDIPPEDAAQEKPRRKVAHPGLGEDGIFHEKGSGDPLPDDTVLRFALVGNQNSGKTTLFNRLTGANRHVGNFPGVTVDRTDGEIRGRKNTVVTDLPGIYSMSPYTSEEIVSRNFVFDEKPHAIINIVDATNIDRNLYLTMQLLEMNIPMVIALNMMDELTANGGSVDINAMEAMLGVPVVPISASKNSGIEELIDHAIHIAHYQERPLEQDFCGKDTNGGAVHRCLHAIAHLIEDHAEAKGLPVRFAASKVTEGDELVLKQLDLDENETHTIDHIVAQLEKERGLDRAAAIADMRYRYIIKVVRDTVHKPRESRAHIRSSRIDRVLTGRYTAIPLFIGIMAAVFFLTFNVIGAGLQKLLEMGIDRFTATADDLLTEADIHPILHGLIIDGIFSGVGTVLSFMPIIVTLFFFLSMLEDSGYIARVAFVMDKMLRKLGLSGRSIVPMLIGFGCTVPAVMSTRTLPSDRDRKMTILLTPFMSCTAKLPIYAFFVDAFFPEKKALIMIGLYLLGILTGIFAALLYKGTVFRGEPVPFVMELPNYRLPAPKNVLLLLWDKAKDFLTRAFSIILVASVVVWVLKSFNFSFNLVSDSHDSMLAVIAGFIAPLLLPLGLGDWRIVTALITGFLAKESVVSTLEVLYPAGMVGSMTSLGAVTMLVFSLLYTPCVAAIASVRRELGHKWALVTVLWQCGIAWLVAIAVRLIGMAFGAS